MVARKHDGGFFRVIWGTFDDFWQETSISGANNAGKARQSPYVRRFLWLIIFGVFFGLTVKNVYNLFVTYREYPVTYSSYVSHQKRIQFPTVTVCNQNRVHCDNLERYIETCEENCEDPLWKILKNMKKSCTGIPGLSDSGPDSSGEPSQSGSSSGESPQGGTSSKGRKKRDAPDGPGEIDPTREAENEFVTSYMTLPSSVRQEIGHNFSSFIQSCTFEGNNCLNESWFFISKSASYGNCFSFNYGHNENDPYAGTRLTALTGSLFGLSLVLNLEQRYYIGDGVTKSAGARIALHSPKVNPLVGETGSDLTPNTLTQVAIQELNLTRMPSPYPSECIGTWEETNYTEYIENNWSYSLLQCQRVCIHSSIVTDCGCFHPLFLDTDANGMEPCDLTQDDSCHSQILDQFAENRRNCSCEVNCEDTDYDAYMSQSKWPSKMYETSAASSFGYADVPANAPGLSENLLSVNVYFKTLNVKMMSEEALYQNWYSEDFISALGGALSLFLGITLSMLFEVVEFVIDVGLNLCIYLSSKK